MTFGLVTASFSLPEGQAVKMIFFARCGYNNITNEQGFAHQKYACTAGYPYRSLCTFQLYPGPVTVGPGRRPNSLLHTARFSLAHKNPGVHGADLLSFIGAHCRPLPPFESHQVFVFVAV